MVLRNRVTNILIGAVNVPGVIYYADKPVVGSGPGGDLVAPQFTANTIQAVGVTTFHAHCEVEIAIDEDETPALYTPSPSPFVPGTPISTLVITEKANDGKTRTITYSTVYMKNVQGLKLENEAEKMPFVFSLLVIGTRVVSAWA
jgi:hypothetical protein